VESGIGEPNGRKLDPPDTHQRQNQQQRAQKGQRQYGIGRALEHSDHEIDVGIVMGRSHAQIRMVDIAVVTVNGHWRLTSVEAEMQVFAYEPQ